MDIKYKKSNYSTTINTEINPRTIIKKGYFFGLAVIVISFASLSYLNIEMPFSFVTIISLILFILVFSIWLKQKKLNKYQDGFLKFENDTLEIRDQKHQKCHKIKEIIEVKEIIREKGFDSVTLNFIDGTEVFNSDHPKYDLIRKAIFEWVYNNVESHEDVYKEIYK